MQLICLSRRAFCVFWPVTIVKSHLFYMHYCINWIYPLVSVSVSFSRTWKVAKISTKLNVSHINTCKQCRLIKANDRGNNYFIKYRYTPSVRHYMPFLIYDQICLAKLPGTGSSSRNDMLCRPEGIQDFNRPCLFAWTICISPFFTFPPPVQLYVPYTLQCPLFFLSCACNCPAF